MKFGDYIRQKREQKSWTQPEAAARANIEQSYLSKLETGKSYPSEDIFNRLVKAFNINTAEMSKQVFSAELEKLREIKDVRTVVLERQKSERSFVRSWLIAGLAFLMLGGASLGFALINDTASQEFYYRSTGVLLPGEPLTTFAIIDEDIASIEYTQHEANDPREVELFKKMLANQQAMIERIDHHDITTTKFRGDSFVEKLPEGKRYYQVYANKEVSSASLRLWLLAPALMFLFGSFGCFFISYRWK